MATEAVLTRRILELERRMDLLFDRLPGLQALPDRGDKLSAIALVREHPALGLAEAKRTVEQMEGS